MGILPEYGNELQQDFVIGRQPDLTYRLDMERGVVQGRADGADAVRQAVYCILSSERFRYEIFSWNYGVELEGLIGSRAPQVYAQIERAVREALRRDDRITAVRDFRFELSGRAVSAAFTVESVSGSFETGLEVEI